MSEPRVTVWNEFRHERASSAVGRIYPEGIHEALAAPLRATGHAVRTATLDEPEHGLGPDVLEATDVLLWWGHQAHAEVQDAVVDRVHARVLEGMGLIALHSAHFSKIFKRLMGTSCDLKWREADERERLWVVAPGHPIATGLPERIDLERHRTIVWLPIVIAATVLIETLLLQAVIDRTVGWGLPGRSLVVSLFVAPLAFALGGNDVTYREQSPPAMASWLAFLQTFHNTAVETFSPADLTIDITDVLPSGRSMICDTRKSLSDPFPENARTSRSCRSATSGLLPRVANSTETGR